jgi:hypothetical protein
LGYPAVVVVSGGGAGTTTLIGHLSNYCKVNSIDDRDGLKHTLRIPRGPRALRSRIVFVRSDIEAQIRSLRRRGTVRFQAIKVGGWRAMLVSSERLDSYFSGVLAKQRSIFEQNTKSQVIIVDFPGFLEDPSKLEQFLDLQGTSFASNMPPLIPRRSGPATGLEQ